MLGQIMLQSDTLTFAVDAHELRHVVSLHIPGAIIQVDIMDEFIMRIDRRMAGVLLEIDKESYGKVMQEVIYWRHWKALHETLQAELLFWQKLSEQLVKRDLKQTHMTNVFQNKVIDGAQCTVVWPVNDLKISH